MSGGIRINVKGYILKRRALAVNRTVDENIGENETHLRTAPQAAADCVDKKPEDTSSLVPETSMVSYELSLMDQVPHLPRLSSASKLECIETPQEWSGVMDPALLDDIIRRNLKFQSAMSSKDLVSESEMTQLCHCSTEIFLSQPNILDLKSPIHIMGDQYTGLSTLLESWGFRAEENMKAGGLSSRTNHLFYVFLGDFMGSPDTICFLLAYKIKYPNNVFLLRGDHECAPNQRYGFYNRRHNVRLWEVFNDCFNCIPVSAIVDGSFIKKPLGLTIR